MRALRLLGLLAGMAAVAIAGGCSTKKLYRDNVPPETRLFVEGTVDTVNHRIHVYWFGTDPDGWVQAYVMRWIFPPPAPQDPKWDTLWCAPPGRPTDSLFTLQTGDSPFLSPTFEIYSVDNVGAVDATPARQTFTVSNLPPSVTILNPLTLTDSTYATVSLAWTVDDPDGGGPGLHYRIWLDGNEAAYDSTSQQAFTVPSYRFLQNGLYASGPRTVYVQPVDDGGRAGVPVSTEWYVRAPGDAPATHGRVLLIDDVSERGASNETFDDFYLAQLDAAPDDVVPPGSWSVLKLELQPNAFRTGRDFAQTLRQFDSVIWYRGFESSISPPLRAFQDSLAAYATAGGRVLLDGLYLIEGLNVTGSMDSTFVPAYLASDEMVKIFSGTIRRVTAGWGNKSSAQFRTSVYPAFPDVRDDLRAVTIAPAPQNTAQGLRVFAVRDTHDVALWAMDSQLSPPNVGDAAVGVVSRLAGGGRIILFSLPIRLLQPAPAGRLAQQVFTTPGSGLLVP